jgi:signal transduction histidine kinase
VVNREVYGTFCFADTEPRDRPFSENEEAFVELMAQWVGYERFQKRATERLQEQRDRLAEFTSVVSHDIRNPLGILDGYLEMAEQTGDPEHFERCHEAVDRMETLIDDLLFLTQEGQTIRGREAVAIDELARECWSFVDAPDATLVVETDRVVSGDWSRLQQVFENLFRNAVEHGGPDVTIRVGDLPEGAGIYVEDDGKGIPTDERDRVFVDGHTSDATGTGLGLTIIQQIVEAHGWEIDVTEGAAGGARFEITDVDGVEG